MKGRRTAIRQRRSRLTVGGVATPLSIIVAYLFHEVLGKDMTQEVAIAFGALLGSMITGASLCFHDIRGIVLDRIYRYRRKPEPLE